MRLDFKVRTMEKNTKICEVCGRELPLSDFSKSYKNRCRECVAAKVRSERKHKMDNEQSDMVKAIVKSTGETVMVRPCHEPINTRTAFYETESGRKFPMFTLEFKKDIDWEQRRYEVAKNAMVGLMAGHNTIYDADKLAKVAMEYADALIAELTKGSQDG